MTAVRVSASGRPLAGDVRLPGDKSIAHRAVLLGALAEGIQRIDGLPRGGDVRSSLAAVEALGAGVERLGPSSVTIHGCGSAFPLMAPAVVDCGNSGTTMRLLAGIAAGGRCPVVLDGDASLRRRPMERVAAPLRAMGAGVSTTDGCPPMRIDPGTLRGITWTLSVASAQVKSAILLAGLRAEGETIVHEPLATRDHTERMLGAMGVTVERRDGAVAIRGGRTPTATQVSLPGDPSSAAFFAVAACIVPGSEVVLRGVCVNPTRAGFVGVLRRMGAAIEIGATRDVGGEPCADVIVRGGPLGATVIEGTEVPDVIDELPVLAVAAACAEGETRISGAAELRMKESDRLAALEQLTALGVELTVAPDGLVIRGVGAGSLAHGRIDARGDHRIAMAFAVAGLRAAGGVEIAGAEAAGVSFPEFFERLGQIGAVVEAAS